jgi:hypothetical protein
MKGEYWQFCFFVLFCRVLLGLSHSLNEQNIVLLGDG